MSEQENGKNHLTDLAGQHRLLSDKINLFENERIITNDPAKLFELNTRLKEFNVQLREIEKELNRDEKNALIQDARRIERNKAYQEAMQIWEKIRQLDTDDAGIEKEIERLQKNSIRAETCANVLPR
jgi:hypothetical protein